MWGMFESLNILVSGLLGVISQLGLLFALLRKVSPGPLFLIVCLHQALLMLINSDPIWGASKLE